MITPETVSRMTPNLLCQHYLLASYCYYQLDQIAMLDSTYDYLIHRLKECFDKLEHRHKHLINMGDLNAGTCLIPLENYPLIVSNSADQYLRNALNGNINEVLLNNN